MDKNQVTVPKFTDWTAERLGSRRWAVCRASARRREKYDVFLSAKQFAALVAEHEALLQQEHTS